VKNKDFNYYSKKVNTYYKPVFFMHGIRPTEPELNRLTNLLMLARGIDDLIDNSPRDDQAKESVASIINNNEIKGKLGLGDGSFLKMQEAGFRIIELTNASQNTSTAEGLVAVRSREGRIYGGLLIGVTFDARFEDLKEGSRAKRLFYNFSNYGEAIQLSNSFFGLRKDYKNKEHFVKPNISNYSKIGLEAFKSYLHFIKDAVVGSVKNN
jgi:hypothetical protein